MRAERGTALGDRNGVLGRRFELRWMDPLPLAALTVGALLAVAVLCGAFVGGVAADDAPAEPASFYGTATDESGDAIPSGETVVAVVDGEVRDSIVVDPEGEYGGSGAFEGKLRVDSGAGDEVTFRLGDAGGPIGGSAELEPGVFEVPLTFEDGSAGTGSGSDGSDTSGSSDGSGDSSDDPDGDAEASDSTGGDGSGDGGEGTSDSGGSGGGSSAGSGGGGTGGGGSGSSTGGGGNGGGSSGGGSGGGSSGVGSGGGSSGGGGSGGASTGSTDDSSGAAEPVAEASRAIEDAYPDAPGTTVVFDGTTIREIAFDDDVDGRVSIREFDNVTGDVPPLPGDLYVVSASVVAVPADARDTPAVVRAVVDPDELRSNRVRVDELSVYRFPTGGDEWKKLPTERFAVDSGLLVEAETPGFSRLVVAGPVRLESTDSGPSPEPTAEAAGAADGDGVPRWLSGSYVLERVGIGRPTAALLALLAVVAVVGWVVVPRRRR